MPTVAAISKKTGWESPDTMIFQSLKKFDRFYNISSLFIVCILEEQIFDEEKQYSSN